MFAHLFSRKPYNLGLTLSGGGAKCMAQIGLLTYLKEQGIEPDIIAGTSGGSIVGALHCAGYQPDDILEFFTSTNMFSLKYFSFTTMGLIDSEKVYRNLKDYFPDDHFEALRKPLKVIATDLIQGKATTFDHGPLIKAISASSAYPGILTPVSWHDTIYADGGILNNFPADAINDQCRFHIGMNLTASISGEPKTYRSTIDVMDRVFHIVSDSRLTQNLHLPDALIVPDGIEQFSAFMVKSEQLHRIYQCGYESSASYFAGVGAKLLSKLKKLPKPESHDVKLQTIPDTP